MLLVDGGALKSYQGTLDALQAIYPQERDLRARVETLEGMVRRSQLATDSFSLLGAVASVECTTEACKLSHH